MTALKEDYINGLSPEVLIDHINENLYSLKGVLESNDFDFKESKANIIETIKLIQSHVLILKVKI